MLHTAGLATAPCLLHYLQVMLLPVLAHEIARRVKVRYFVPSLLAMVRPVAALFPNAWYIEVRAIIDISA